MTVTNVQRLTRGDRKYAAKKRASSIPEVKFDQESRKDFLTGFHKRKLARQAEAKRRAEEINRAERIAERQKVREERKASINMGMERLKEAEEIISGITNKNDSLNTSKARFVDEDDDNGITEDSGQQDEFAGFQDNIGSGILKHRSTYGDSQVTFEEIDLDPYVDVARSQQVLDEATEKAQSYAKYVAQVEAHQKKVEDVAKKQKKKKFRYLPKSERKLMNRKSRSR